jgi:hypothetical protein
MYAWPSKQETKASSIASPLKSITFVLAGRTTLSEHCPTEHIEVDYPIAERSPYLRIYLPQHIKDDRPLLPIQLGNVDPTGFRLYIEWLTTGAVSFSTQRSLRLDSCIDLIYAHIVGSAFSQPHFQDYIIDTLAQVLDPAQVFDQKILEMLFLEKHASTLLRQFIIDRMFAYEKRLLGMIRNSVEDIVTGHSDVKGCEYHMHEKGVCYKHGKDEDAQDLNCDNEVGEKKWSIDDDLELNAMAAQYLGKKTTNPTPLTNSPPSWRKTPKTQQQVFASQRKRLPVGAAHTVTTQKQNSITKPRELCSPQLSIRSFCTNIDMDKPLPPTPECVQTPSTQELVLECLGRLPPTPTLTRTSTQDLVDEYLARSTTHTASSPTPLPSPPSSSSSASQLSSCTDSIPPSLRPGSRPSTHPTRNLTYAPFPKSKAQPENSTPHRPPSPPSLALQLQRPYHISPSSPSLPHFAPLIKRKPAPPRGTDWLEQWDRLFALQGTQGFGLRRGEKKERRSRFLEILGSVGSGGSMVRRRAGDCVEWGGRVYRELQYFVYE